MREVKYDPSTTRKTIAESAKDEAATKKAQYEQSQTQNMDAAFTDAVEEKKQIDPTTGAVTYALYLDPDKYSQALFKRSKETGIPFKMDDAQAYSKYQLERQKTINQQGQATIQGQQIGIQPEARINPTSDVTRTGTLPEPSVGETRKAKDGKTYTFRGDGWYDQSSGVRF